MLSIANFVAWDGKKRNSSLRCLLGSMRRRLLRSFWSDEVRVDDHEQVLMVMLWSTFFDLAGIELGEG